MKKIFCLLSVLAIILILQSFIFSFPNQVKDHELAKGETLNFETKPLQKKNWYSAMYIRGSYDLSSYTINIDTQGHLNISDLRGSYLKHQGELSLFHAKGNISRIGDTLKIQAETKYDKFYIISVKENGIIDSLSANINIAIVSKTLENKYCPNLVSIISGVEICALPKKVKKDEIYKPSHEDNTIGEFVYFSIIDSQGNSRVFSHGDYVIIGGDSLTLTK